MSGKDSDSIRIEAPHGIGCPIGAAIVNDDHPRDNASLGKSRRYSLKNEGQSIAHRDDHIDFRKMRNGHRVSLSVSQRTR